MSKIAFIYPGQGAQKAGMGADFYENSEIARYIFDQAGEELDLDMKELCFEENDRLDLTEYTQAAMVTTCLAMTRVAESKGLKADITAGLSLGEYPAIAAAGGMNDMDAIRLVRKRGILMQNTVPAGEGAMCAVISMAAEEIEKVIEPIADVSVANYNCPGQIVITGKTDARRSGCKVKRSRGETHHYVKCQRTVPFSDAGSGRRETGGRTGTYQISRIKNSVCNECNSREGNRHQRNSGTSYDTDQFTGALDAEHGTHDRRRC